MEETWIVSANASRARFFSQMDAKSVPEEFNDMINEGGRMSASELETDSRGPTASSKSVHGVGAATPTKLYQPEETLEKHQAVLFARDIAAYLQKAHNDKRFQKLALVVSPKFLGALRKELDQQVQAKVFIEINKDYTSLAPQALREQIIAHKP